MSSKVPIVSVIIPAYRSEQVLARALGGLLAQDLRDWEAVIVDDGSPEASWGIVQAYGWLDPRIRAVRQVHGGVCTARNTGIAEAQGEYLLFLDADDWLESDAIGAMVDACERNGWSAAHGRLRYATSDGTPTTWTGGCPPDRELFEAVSSSNVLSVPSCVMLRRRVLCAIGVFDTSLVHCGDWDLWARLARHDGGLGAIDQIVTNYRMSRNSLSRNPLTLLRDATTVIKRIHAPDKRVMRPRRQYAQGVDPAQLGVRVVHFSVYAAGLALAGGQYNRVESVLDTVAFWPRLSAEKVGLFLFYALCFARCYGPEGFQSFWPHVRRGVERLLSDLEDRSGTADLARDAWLEMQANAGDDLSLTAIADSAPPSINGLIFPAVSGAWETYADAMLRSLAGGGPP